MSQKFSKSFADYSESANSFAQPNISLLSLRRLNIAAFAILEYLWELFFNFCCIHKFNLINIFREKRLSFLLPQPETKSSPSGLCPDKAERAPDVPIGEWGGIDARLPT